MQLIRMALARNAAVFLVLLIPTASIATEPKPESEGMLLAKAIASLENPMIDSERTSVVSAFERYCGALKNVFPTNSPSEDEWIWREIEGGSDRAIRALASKEWARFEAEKFTSRCLEVTQIYREKPEFRTQAVFLLIEATSSYAPDAERGARINGVAPAEWGFLVLGPSATRSLTKIGVMEANLLYQAAHVGENVGK